MCHFTNNCVGQMIVDPDSIKHWSYYKYDINSLLYEIYLSMIFVRSTKLELSSFVKHAFVCSENLYTINKHDFRKPWTTPYNTYWDFITGERYRLPLNGQPYVNYSDDLWYSNRYYVDLMAQLGDCYVGMKKESDYLDMLAQDGMEDLPILIPLAAIPYFSEDSKLDKAMFKRFYLRKRCLEFLKDSYSKK